MRKLIEISRTSVDLILLHPLRSAVTTACLVAILTPFLVGVGISRGIVDQAETSIRLGADLYVGGARFGRPAPVPVELVERIRAIDGVTGVTPRIVCEVVLGAERVHAVLVGIDPEHFETAADCVRGRLFARDAENELVLGSDLARRLRLDVGSRIPPFYRNSRGDRVSTVVGVFQSDVSLWQANVMFASFETAAKICDQPGWATDLLVECRPGYAERIASAIANEGNLSSADGDATLSPRVTTRDELAAQMPRDLSHREALFDLHFLPAFAICIPLVLATSGLGLSERRREIGLLKALGWQTDEVLVRGLVESLLISLAAASIAVLLAFVWLEWLNGYWIAGMLLAGVDAGPSFEVPFRLTPWPVCLGLLVSLAIVMTGTSLSTWRAAVAAPAEAMR